MPPDQSPVYIVVVEDNTPDVVLLEECLSARSISFEMQHFKDGAEAITHLFGESSAAAKLPDVIVLDLNMPKINGLELLARLKNHERFAGVPVAVLTSSLAPEEQAEAERMGADRYLRKSADLDEFLREAGNMIYELACGKSAVKAGIY
jgi:CheY-like chemotaxis protein